MKLWGGRFEKETSKVVDEFNSSIFFDSRLYRQDIRGSIAHARMLGRCGILSKEEAEKIVKGLQDVLEDIETGKAEFSLEAEDIHMNIEILLTQKIGDLGKKLHTARSRNDQVNLDLRLFLKEEINEIQELILYLIRALLEASENHVYTIMPGYTHLQKAQPVTLAHHLMAYVQMLERDLERYQECYRRVDVMPLGAGALAGTTFPVDREFIARELGFSRVSENSLDTVSDRDFAIEFLADSSMLMAHLSRFCEEIVLWATEEFNFVEVDDAHSTGSSIMPQKKNPDVAELVRGKSGRVFGHLISLLSVIKSLPLAYNKDLQEDKEPIFDTVDTVKKCLNAFTEMFCALKFHKEKMLEAAEGGYINATDVADYLVKKGIAFREAHKVVGKMVRHCIGRKKRLEELNIHEFRQFSEHIEEDIYETLKLENCIKKRSIKGGPSPEMVKSAIAAVRRRIQKNEQLILSRKKNGERVQGKF